MIFIEADLNTAIGLLPVAAKVLLDFRAQKVL